METPADMRRRPRDRVAPCRVCAAINCCLAETNAGPKPLVWTAEPDRVIEKAHRARQVLGQA